MSSVPRDISCPVWALSWNENDSRLQVGVELVSQVVADAVGDRLEEEGADEGEGALEQDQADDQQGGTGQERRVAGDDAVVDRAGEHERDRQLQAERDEEAT